MRVSRRLLAALVLLLSVSPLWANLPDEVNHPPYRIAHEQSQEQTRSRQANLEQASDAQEQATRNLQELKDRKQQLENERASGVSDQQRLENEIRALEQAIANERSAIESAEQEQRAVSGQREVVLRERDGVARELNAARSRLQNLNNELSLRIADRDRAAERLQGAQNQAGRLARELEQTTNELSAAERELDRLEREGRQAQQAIPVLEREVVQNERRKEQASEQVRSARLEVAKAKRELDPAQAELNAAKADLAEAERLYAPIEGQIRDLSTKIAKAERAKTKLETEISDLERQYAAANATRVQLENEIKQKEDQLNAANARLPQLNASIINNTNSREAKNNQVIALGVRLTELRAGPQNPATQREITSIMGQRRDLLREVAQLDREIAKEQSEKDGFVTLIASLNSELPALRTRLSQTAPRGEEILNAIKAKKLEVRNIDQEIKVDRQSIASLQTQSQALRHRVQIAGVRVQNANNTVSAINTRITSAERSAEQGLARVQELSREIAAANTQIERNQRTMDENRRRIVQLRPARDQLASRASTLARGLDSVERDIRVQENEVSRMQATVSQVGQDRDAQARQTQAIEARDQELVARIATLEQNIDRLIANINAANERVAQNTAQVNQASASVSSIVARRAQLDREIPGMNARIGQAQSDLQSADRVLAQANSSLDLAKQEEARALAAFQSRLQKYNTELSKSQALGSSQAQAAANPQGRAAGQSEALSLAAKNANRVGLVRAQLDGKLRGLLSGKEVGFADGLNAGLNSAADRQEALRLGDEAGSRAATQEANETTLPETYRATLTSILSSLPKSAFLKDLVKRFDLEETIKQTREEVALWQDPARNLSVSAYAYKAPQVPVDRSSKNCSGVYKGVREFIAACDQAFDQAFSATFSSSHQSSFASRYDGAYASTYTEVFAARKNDLYQESYDLAYTPRYNEGLVEGKRRIRETSFEEGRVAGYNRSLPVARAQASAQGQQQARDYVQNNAVVRSRNNFDGALSADSRAEQGKELSLTLKAANFGAKASIRGESTAVVEVLSGNARVLAKDIAIPGIAAKKQSNLAGLIKLQVSDSAVPGDDIIVQVKLTHKGDAYSSKFEETLRLGTEVVANPEVGSSLDFEREPDMRGIFGYKKQDVKVKLVGLRPYVPGSYSVKLLPASESDARMVEITKDESSVGVLDRGQSRDAELEYKFNKHAKGETVNLRIVISYDGEILKEEVIQVQPK